MGELYGSTCIILLPNIDDSKLCGDCQKRADWWAMGGNAFYGVATGVQFTCTECLESLMLSFPIEDNFILDLVNKYNENPGLK